MNAADWAVLAGAAASIAWVNWYFFMDQGPATATTAGAGGVQEVTVTVDGGYSPSTVRVRAGAPVRLLFDRRETSGCTEEVVLGDFGIRRFLPAHQSTPVEFTPPAAGTYEFTCGMNMIRGRVVAE